MWQMSCPAHAPHTDLPSSSLPIATRVVFIKNKKIRVASVARFNLTSQDTDLLQPCKNQDLCKI